jgi:CheY-like chemotaxis protein
MSLDRTRVLIAEDEPILLLGLEDMLGDLGCRIEGRAATLASALQQAHDLAIDVALLDIDLGGNRVDPVADVLKERGIPFVFTTGYSSERTSAHHGAAPIVAKPYRLEDLRAALLQAIGAGAARVAPSPAAPHQTNL